MWDVGRVKSNEEKVAEVTIKAVNFNEDQIISNFTVIGYVYIDDGGIIYLSPGKSY